MPKLPVGRFGFSCPLFGLKRSLWLKAQSPAKPMRLVRRLTFIGGEGGMIPDVLCTSALCIYAAPTIALPRGQSNRRSHPTGRSQPRLRRATERVGLSPTLSGLCILASPSGSACARGSRTEVLIPPIAHHLDCVATERVGLSSTPSRLCIFASPTIAVPRGQSNRRSHPTGRSQPRLRRATERVGLSPTLSGLCILASPSGSANARAVKLKFSSHQEVITSTASSNGEGGIRSDST